MGKEEMKNKISMALKDSVLQIGFEIICKNLSELEAENAELKEENAVLKSRNAELAGQKANLQRWLGEATKLLTRFVWASAYFNGEEADLVESAKQFLKED